MNIKRKKLIAYIYITICLFIGLCLFAIPTKNVAYADESTSYSIEFTCEPARLNEVVEIYASDQYDYSTGTYHAMSEEEVSVSINVQSTYEDMIFIKRLYYTSKTDPTTQIEINLETKKFIMPAYDIVVHGEFDEPIAYTINKQVNSGGRVSSIRSWYYGGDSVVGYFYLNSGYQVESLYYITTSNVREEITIDGRSWQFIMPHEDITLYIEFEKIPYSITIPEHVTVKRGDEILTNESDIYIGDELTFSYDMPEHFNARIEVNNKYQAFDKPFVVGTQDVVITYFCTQIQFQLTWEENEYYTISMFNEDEPGNSGDWIYESNIITLAITPVTGYKVKQVWANSLEATLIDGKWSFEMPEANTVISVKIVKIFMMDWTDEDTHSFTIKNGDYIAGSPDWFEKGETLTITVAPQPGYRVTKILANDVQISTSDQAIYVMTEENIDFTAEVEKIAYSIKVYEWYADYANSPEKEFKYIGEQTATFGDSFTIKHQYDKRIYSCGDFFYLTTDEVGNMDYTEDMYWSCDDWETNTFDSMPASSIIVYFELYEWNCLVTIPDNITIELLERYGERLEPYTLYTNTKDNFWYCDKIKITATQTDHFTTNIYAHNSTLHSETSNGIYLGTECVGVFSELFSSVIDKAYELEIYTLPITFKTIQTQYEWMIDWTDEDTHSFTIKNDIYQAESPDWFEKGTELTISIAPAMGYRVTKILANNEVISLTNEVTFIMQDQDVDFTAEVEKINYAIIKDSNIQHIAFDISKTTATLGETINIMNIVVDNGYRLNRMFYVGSDEVQVNIADNSFSMPAENITVCVEVEKIPYSITIPEHVTVKRGETYLNNSDKVYVDDKLTIIYESLEHFETIVKVNNNIADNGYVFSVGAEDVVITYESYQNEWQVVWKDNEDCTISIFNGTISISNGDWFKSGVELTIDITPKNPETHEVTKVLMNGNAIALNNGKFTTRTQNATISAVIEAKEIAVKNDSDHAIVIDKRENIKNTILEVIAIEETAEEYQNILQKLDNLKTKTTEKTKNMKAYAIKLLKDGRLVELTTTAKVLLLIPELFEENTAKLYRQTENGLIEQTYIIKTIGEKRYALFNTSTLGTFAFASFEEVVTSNYKLDKKIVLGIIAGVIVAVGTTVTIVKTLKKKKKN